MDMEPDPGTPTFMQRLALRSYAERLREWGLTALLVMLIITVFVVPAFLPDGDEASVLRDVAFTGTLIAGAASVAERRALSYIFVALAAVAILTRWVEWVVPRGLLSPVHHAATLLAIILLGGIVGKGVFGAGRVTLDRVMGAIVLYLLLGIGFAVGYESISRNVPGAFAGALDGPNTLERWAYFSFVTLTTVGYGDITPVATIARALATFEAFIGQLYPAVILARLVSLQIAPPPDKS